MRYGSMCLLAVAATCVVLLFGRAGGEPPVRGTEIEHSFGDIVLYIVTKPKDSKSDSGYALYEKPTIAHLGGRAFIVGTVPDYGDDEAAKAAAGKRVWTPVSDVVQMTEFKTLAEAKRYFAAPTKPVEKAGQRRD
ncbi:hypothetical protein GobsT_10940 [Gemmata obscuriglobus]|uniref:Uncharacterized protein n=1 Tax=Gemmata obscuriglobus TaxID=114 RepID=A0A2Z3H3R2_9BACT|nr:hypothetical protein [Gemmata obscuriglobus]AWM40408.1 hypothetical protein C1280_27770 [Gemmata obscuriglobus]QEG26355.1 hypothetical protein GobsT_10940 [Gemmata obscuriglobus]VTS01355.1 unnamed protein product [Gemmata obscuriglobus UQM 2246]